MRREFTFLLAAVVAALVLQTACSSANPDAVSADDLGLYQAAVTDNPAPEPFAFADASPGAGSRLTPAYDGSPPIIPHALDGLVPITTSDNFCVLCHASGDTSPEAPPQAPASHFTDLRSAEHTVSDSVAGARWVCTSCHVPQTDAPPLVGNTFGSAASGR